MVSNPPGEGPSVVINGASVPWGTIVPKTGAAFTGGLGAAIIICVAGKYGITVDPMAANLIVASVAGLASYIARNAHIVKGN